MTAIVYIWTVLYSLMIAKFAGCFLLLLLFSFPFFSLFFFFPFFLSTSTPSLLSHLCWDTIDRRQTARFDKYIHLWNNLHNQHRECFHPPPIKKSLCLFVVHSYPTPQLLTPTNLFSVPITLCSWRSHINRIIQYEVSWVWLLSLSLVCLRHVYGFLFCFVWFGLVGGWFGFGA